MLFFPLNIPLNLPPGDGDRRLGLWGGSKLVLLRRTRSSLGSLDSIETDRLDGKVEDLDALLLESTSVAGDVISTKWPAWMMGEDVVRWPIWDGWDERVVARGRDLEEAGSGSDSYEP